MRGKVNLIFEVQILSGCYSNFCLNIKVHSMILTLKRVIKKRSNINV